METIEEFHGEYYFLSNFFSVPVTWDGITYPTNEHAFQAAKTLMRRERDQIALAPTPGKAKYFGRRILLRGDWEDVKTNIMKEIVTAKFTQNPQLKDKLLATGDATLIEGNDWNDLIWGMVNGRGENRLGKILMEVREELKIV